MSDDVACPSPCPRPLQAPKSRKNFLASQGMIKGHSGSGARSSEQPPILRLTPESDSTPYHGSSSSSPPSPPSRSLPNTEYPSGRPTWDTTYEPYHYPRGSEPRWASPQSNEGYSPHLTPSPSTVQSTHRIQYRYHPYAYRLTRRQLSQQPYFSPAMQSNLADSYNLDDSFFAAELEENTDLPGFNMGDAVARPANELVLQIPDKNGGDLNSAEDAMAALHLVSVVLFNGGCGAWRHYLEFTARYVRGKMRGLGRNVDGLEELRKLSQKEAFIVKTAIWFDVLASVSTGKKPQLMDVIRPSFKPGQSGLEKVGIAFSSSSSSSYRSSSSILADAVRLSKPDEEKSSMVSPMGCQNKVVWALAEINALAAWKKEQNALGRLSVKELVLRSDEIERELVKDKHYDLLKHHHYVVQILSDFHDDPIAYSRYLTSNIFRVSAMLYLHSVVSGGYPHVIQIKVAVEEVMKWIRRIPKKPRTEVDRKIHRSVVRNTVFGFYITGALTDDWKDRKVIQEYLLEEAGEHVGNVKIVADVLDDIWKEREVARRERGKKEVSWREKLSVNGEAAVWLA